MKRVQSHERNSYPPDLDIRSMAVASSRPTSPDKEHVVLEIADAGIAANHVGKGRLLQEIDPKRAEGRVIFEIEAIPIPQPRELILENGR